MHPLDDTIAAIASPPGGAARGIIRISGPEAVGCLTRLFRSSAAWVSEPSARAISGELILSDLHSPLPCDVYSWPEGRSYTGQSVVEIHTLGSAALLDAVLRSLCASGARLAQPGEFTLRAFLSGRIDLTQAEAVLGVIDAGDSKELHVALGQLAGGLARPLHRLRETLLDLLAHLEAGFDFADEDISFITREQLEQRLAEAETDITAICRQMVSRTETIGAVRAVLVGRPNTGKSSLFNTLAGHRAALVSDRPGTTRDYLSADLDLDGVKCRLIDTAGMADEKCFERVAAEDAVDRTAVEASIEQHREAHVQLLCIDSTRPPDSWECDRIARAAEYAQITLLTKCDAPERIVQMQDAVETSSRTGKGIAELQNSLRAKTLHATRCNGDVVAGTAVRCAESLRLAIESIHRARQAASGGQEELVAAEIRAALGELGKVVGEVYTEDVLDRIFSRFCVGK